MDEQLPSGRKLRPSQKFAVLSSDKFRILIAASPERVWGELTRSGEPTPHLYGLIARSDWQTMSTVTFGPLDGPHLIGQVLLVDPPRKLTFSLGDQINEPSVYLTWELIPAQEGSIVRLYIDETESSFETDREAVWLPMLQLLQARLRPTQPADGDRPPQPPIT